jgi:hypothetical protein
MRLAPLEQAPRRCPRNPGRCEQLLAGLLHLLPLANGLTAWLYKFSRKSLFSPRKLAYGFAGPRAIFPRMDDPHDDEDGRINSRDDLTDVELDSLARFLIGTDADPWDAICSLGLTCDWDDQKLRKKLCKGTRLRRVTAKQCQFCERWFRGDRCKQCKIRLRKQCKVAHPSVEDGFNYVAIGHRGEHLASIYDIPRPWPESNDSAEQCKAADRADFEYWCAIQRWIQHGSRHAFWEFYIASLRWLPVVIQRSRWIEGDKRDAFAVCSGAAFDAIVKLRDHYPSLKLYVPLYIDDDDEEEDGIGCDPTDDGDDGVEFNYLNPKYERVTGHFRCRKYVRYIRDEAQKALNDNQRRVRKEWESGRAYFQRRYARGRDTKEWFPNRNWTNNDFLSEPERQLHEAELFEEAAKRLDCNEDPMMRRIIDLKMNNHDMTTSQIAQKIESELDIRRDATTIGRHINEQLEDLVAWLDVKPRNNKKVKFKRATGVELQAEKWCATLGEHCDVPTGLWEAKQKYEFDASHFKKSHPRPTILSRPALKRADKSLGMVS